MIVKVNKDLEHKLNVASKKHNIPKAELIKKIFQGFIGRYEQDYGEIKEKREKKRGNIIYSMYGIFKEYYAFINNDEEYEVDTQKEKIDLRNTRLIRDKIVQEALKGTEAEVIAVEDEDILDAFRFYLEKTPNWWKKNSFTLHSLNKNFEKILKQAKNGHDTKKEQLDIFINSLEAQ